MPASSKPSKVDRKSGKNIPWPSIEIDLRKTTPDKCTRDNMEPQLVNMGLTCEQAHGAQLEKNIEDVRKDLPRGKTQCYGIYSPKDVDTSSGDWRSILRAQEVSVPNWEPRNSSPYQKELGYIQYPEHFDFLVGNRPTFAGRTRTNNYEGDDPTESVIKETFVNVAYVASAAVVDGLDKEDMESALTNAIDPMNPQSTDYETVMTRTFYLVDRYDGNGQCEGVGVLNVQWKLTIIEYKDKKVAEKDWKLSVTSRAVCYSDIHEMEADFIYAASHFGDLRNANPIFFGARDIPWPDPKIEIFDQKPEANDATFYASLPLRSSLTSSKAEAMVFFKANIQSLGIMDNTNSSAETKWSRSVTSGFSFSRETSVSSTTYMEASTLFLASGVEFHFGMTFTEQWNQSVEETMTVSVAGGAKVFFYQGYILGQVLQYDTENGKYEYVDSEGRFMTDILITSDKPLVALPDTKSKYQMWCEIHRAKV